MRVEEGEQVRSIRTISFITLQFARNAVEHDKTTRGDYGGDHRADPLLAEPAAQEYNQQQPQTDEARWMDLARGRRARQEGNPRRASLPALQHDRTRGGQDFSSLERAGQAGDETLTHPSHVRADPSVCAPPSQRNIIRGRVEQITDEQTVAQRAAARRPPPSAIRPPAAVASDDPQMPVAPPGAAQQLGSPQPQEDLRYTIAQNVGGEQLHSDTDQSWVGSVGGMGDSSSQSSGPFSSVRARLAGALRARRGGGAGMMIRTPGRGSAVAVERAAGGTTTTPSSSREGSFRGVQPSPEGSGLYQSEHEPRMSFSSEEGPREDGRWQGDVREEIPPEFEAQVGFF